MIEAKRTIAALIKANSQKVVDVYLVAAEARKVHPEVDSETLAKMVAELAVAAGRSAYWGQ